MRTSFFLGSIFSTAMLALCATVCLLGCLPGGCPQAEAMQFKVSQIGYHPNGPKIAYLQDVPEGRHVKIVLFDPNWTDRLKLLKGHDVYKIVDPKPTDQAQQLGPAGNALTLDFSEFTTPGSYELRVEGHPEVQPQPIEISDYVYWDQLKPVLKTFYYQRSGQKLRDSRHNFYFFDCLTDDNIRVKNAKNVTLDVTWDAGGGWYDDGGFGKSVTTNALAAARLMALYNTNPKSFQFFKLDYPYEEEGVGTVPDVMLEIKAGLNWLMEMQRLDGSVYSGVEGKPVACDARDNFDLDDRHVLDATTKDTASAAAVLAMAERTFRDKDMGYAVKSLRAAENAWSSLEATSATREDLPFRLWASLELYISTGKSKYDQYFQKNYAKVGATPTANIAQNSLIYTQDNPMLQTSLDYLTLLKTQNTKIAESMRNKILDQASQLADQIDALPLQGGLDSFTDPSNYRLVENINILLFAYQLNRHENGHYREAASKAITYLYGLNPLWKTYISGIGDSPVKHLLMQRFSADTLAGYLVSGPNENPSDGVTPKGMGALSFVDNARATAVNRINLLYNAELAFALSELNASYNLNQDQPEKPKSNKYHLPILN